jgi:HMG-box domain
LGDQSTISAVLYANQNHPELKIEYPSWNDRYKQIMKKWRALSAERKAPYLQRARDNRSAQQAQLRTKKAQQVRIIVSHDIEAKDRSRIQMNVLFLSVANWDLFFIARIFRCVI